MRLLMVSARPETAQRNLHVKQTVSQTKLAAPASVKIVSMTPVSIATSARQKITAQKTLTPVTVAVMPAPLKITAQKTLPATTIVSTPTVAIGKSAMPITSTATDVAARGGVTPIASGQASVAQLVRLPTLVNRPRVGFITDNRMLEHVCACQHYENPQRLQSITTALRYMSRPFFVLQSREATDQELATCHNVKAILKQISEIEIRPSDEYDDMYAVPGKTLLAARLAAGCSIQLVQDIVADKIDCGFAAVRPPGHHAHYDHVAGFCFFNNAVLAAVAAASANKRVLIVDFDVHFGDGTTNILGQLDNRNLACVSIHRYDLYPNSEDDMKRKTVSSERLLNIYFTGTRGDKYYIKEFKEKLLPFAQKFVPDLIVVSGGFDAALGDPLGECRVTPDGYRTLIQLLKTVSPKIAILLEGGYNLTAIAKSAVACVEALFEESNLLPSAQTRLPPSEANFAPLKPLALPVASMLTAPALPKITNETVRKTEQS